MKDADSGAKWLPAAKVVELLQTLDGDCRVMINSIGNLLVLSADGQRNVAYVDFWGDGEIELYD